MQHDIDGIKINLSDQTIPENFKSVLVIIKKDNKFLMVKNKCRAWEFTGGTREAEESSAETSKREAFEEAGAEIKDIKYHGLYILPTGELTLITTAKLISFNSQKLINETEKVELFTKLPKNLSFTDGLYNFLIDNLYF